MTNDDERLRMRQERAQVERAVEAKAEGGLQLPDEVRVELLRLCAGGSTQRAIKNLKKGKSNRV